jgi:glycosyltransferase involved in cell wall biosynthesis
MRILVVSSYPPRHCGIGAYARDQVRELRAAGHDVTVVTSPDGDGDVTGELLGGKAFRVAARMGGSFDRIVVHFQPALYYRPRAPLSKIVTSLSLLWLALRRPRLGIVVHEADPPILWRPDYALLALAFRSAGRVVFHTEAEREALERGYHVRVRSAIVPHRVLPVGPIPPRDEARAALAIDGRGPVLLCAGFLHPGKGFDRAISAFAASGAAEHRARLFVVGSIRQAESRTQDRTFVEDLRGQAEATPGVSFAERFLSDEDLDRWIVAADALVLPYLRSWSSGLLARAHALGTPAIVTDVGGLAEQAEPADIVVRDEAALTAAIAGVRRGHRAPIAGGSGEPAPEAPRPVRPPVVSTDGDSSAGSSKGNGMLLGMILLSVVLAAVAQLTLKYGMNQVTHNGAQPLVLGSPAQTAGRIASVPMVWIGLVIFGLSAIVWLIVLSRASLSFAYPFASLTYVIIVLFDRFVLGQDIPSIRYLGVALIVAGIVLISRTHA